MKKANKAIRKAKQDDVCLHFPDLGDISKAQIISFSDAFFSQILKMLDLMGALLPFSLDKMDILHH